MHKTRNRLKNCGGKPHTCILLIINDLLVSDRFVRELQVLIAGQLPEKCINVSWKVTIFKQKWYEAE